MLKKIGITFLCTICCYFTCSSQEIEVNGGFLQEDIKIGEPVQYYLKAKYPSRLEVLFPGEDYNYEPFEYIDKQYFPSAYDSAFVIDSAVYTLTSFEIDPFQSLKLPVYLITNGDSVSITSLSDSLKFIEIAPAPSDSLQLKTDLTFLDVPLRFNYPYLLIGTAIVVVVLLAIALVFGRKIINSYRIRKLRKGFKVFSEHYDELVYLIDKSGEKKHLENTIAYWKSYLEKLEKVPYTKLTTRELIAVKNDERLVSELKVIDKNLYGNLQSEDLRNRLIKIKSLAREYQENKIATIKNG
ncbi:MAG: hypothetical protein WBA74_21410 [Cyclobacteriaceae bacterium]